MIYVCACVFVWVCMCQVGWMLAYHWRLNERDSFSNHQPHGCLLNRLFRLRWKKTPKLRITGLCEGNSPVTGEFPAQKASITENVSIWWRHHSYGRDVELKMFLWSSIAQSVCGWTLSLLESWFLRHPGSNPGHTGGTQLVAYQNPFEINSLYQRTV